MRRLAALGLAAVALTACSGEQGERAQQLLTRAQAAQARLHSAAFDARITFALDGQRFSLAMDGGSYFKGRRAGDQLLTMRTDGVPGAGAMNMQMRLRRGQASMTMNGKSFAMPVTTASAKQQYDWSSTMLELARYVKDVRVLEDRLVNGKRGATVTGVLDAGQLMKAAAKLDGLTRASNVDSFDGKLGDIHAALFIEEQTGLIRSAVITMSVSAHGQKALVDLTYRLKSTNKAIAGL